MITYVRKCILVWSLLAVWLLAACNPCARLSRRCPPVASVQDSVWCYDTLIREVKVVDTLQVVRLVGEQMSAVVLATDTARAETRYSMAEAHLTDGGTLALRVSNKDSAEIWTKKIEALEYQLSRRERLTAVTKIKEVRYVPGFIKFLAWVGGIALLYILIRIAIKVLLSYVRF